jgi:hypothetical protein
MKIILHKIEATYPVPLTVIRDREYQLYGEFCISYHTDCGVISFTANAGFKTDGRSGGRLVDLLLPNVGDGNYQRIWLGHDMAYALEEKGITFELANELFRQGLTVSKRNGGAGISSIRAWLAWRGVESHFGRKAYETKDRTDKANKGLVSFGGIGA